MPPSSCAQTGLKPALAPALTTIFPPDAASRTPGWVTAPGQRRLSSETGDTDLALRRHRELNAAPVLTALPAGRPPLCCFSHRPLGASLTMLNRVKRGTGVGRAWGSLSAVPHGSRSPSPLHRALLTAEGRYFNSGGEFLLDTRWDKPAQLSWAWTVGTARLFKSTTGCARLLSSLDFCCCSEGLHKAPFTASPQARAHPVLL